MQKIIAMGHHGERSCYSHAAGSEDGEELSTCPYFRISMDTHWEKGMHAEVQHRVA